MAKRLAVYCNSLNPPGLHDRRAAEALRRSFDHVLIAPAGHREGKTDHILPAHRAAMIDLAFRGVDVEIDLSDLEDAAFSHTHDLNHRYSGRGDVWHVIGSNFLEGGARGQSLIHKTWHRGEEAWQKLNFAVVERPGHQLDKGDLPPRHHKMNFCLDCTGTEIRDRLLREEPVEHLVPSYVAEYIARHGLYTAGGPRSPVRYQMRKRGVMLFYDERNPKATGIADKFRHLENKTDPGCILVVGGDGTMLKAIRDHWRLRLPYYGINAGHLGFLLNEADENGDSFPDEVLCRPMPLLYIEMLRKDGVWIDGVTFNDAWVERASGQTAWLEVKLDGVTKLSKLTCDGMLVATAAGSTAYARSMGATPLLASTPAWLMVGSNVSQPAWKSAVLSLETRVEIKNLDPNKRPLNGYLYGQLMGEVMEVKARVSRIALVELAFSPGHDITEKMRDMIQFPKEGARLVK